MAQGVGRYEVLGVKVSAVNLTGAAAAIADFIRIRTKVYVCVAPVSTIISCQDDPAYQEVVNAAAMVTPDGMPLVWLAHRQGYKNVGRAYGPDLMRLVCDQGRQQKCRHFLYGASEETNQQLKEKLEQEYPGIVIAGREAPLFRELSFAEQEQAIQRINQTQADIVWVGLGSPKQDFWMAQNRAKLNAPVLVGVGAAFDFLAGTKKQAPLWMRQNGLEWLFRFSCEPRRLARRYVVGNTRFLCLLMRQSAAVHSVAKKDPR